MDEAVVAIVFTTVLLAAMRWPTGLDGVRVAHTTKRVAEQIAAIRGVMLGLLSLLLGFTFSLVVTCVSDVNLVRVVVMRQETRRRFRGLPWRVARDSPTCFRGDENREFAVRTRKCPAPSLAATRTLTFNSCDSRATIALDYRSGFGIF